MHMLIYTCSAICKSVHAQAIAGYLLIPEVSTVLCFCLAVKVLRLTYLNVLKFLRPSATLPILGALDNKYSRKFFAVHKTAKLLHCKTKAIHGISMSHLVRVTLHCGRSWVISELQGETNH